MAWIEINPQYREVCERHGLAAPDDFLTMPALIISGHPNRHVARVAIGEGPASLIGYLKREHRISWRERVHNAWHGFGPVSRSSREASVLHQLKQVGVGCPEPIAVGEDTRGRGFVLLRELDGAVELRAYLRQRLALPQRRRDQFARRLGQALAHVHNSGFDHPDLYSKHVFIDRQEQIRFLDWQRSRPHGVVGWRRRWRDLAALAATLGEDLVPQRERLLCLRAYLRACRLQRTGCPGGLLGCAFRILVLQQRFLRHRRVRELREAPLQTIFPQLAWQDGEALCLTPELRNTLQGQIPAWLSLDHLPRRPGCFQSQVSVDSPNGHRGQLQRRREHRPLSRLSSWLRSRRPTSPELLQAGLLFRLQRYGIPGPRVLAFGQRVLFPWKVESFLFTDWPEPGIPLHRWLKSAPDAQERRRLIREAGTLLRRVHQAGCFLGASNAGKDDFPFHVVHGNGSPARLVLGAIPQVLGHGKANLSLAVQDLRRIHHALVEAYCNRAEGVRLVVSYVGLAGLTPQAKRLARLVFRPARGGWPFARLFTSKPFVPSAERSSP